MEDQMEKLGWADSHIGEAAGYLTDYAKRAPSREKAIIRQLKKDIARIQDIMLSTLGVDPDDWPADL